MCKELTVVTIFLLGLLADILWFEITPDFGFIFFLQIGLAIFLLTFIILAGKKYLIKRFYLRPKSLSASTWKFDRLRFLHGFWKRQIPLPRV